MVPQIDVLISAFFQENIFLTYVQIFATLTT